MAVFTTSSDRVHVLDVLRGIALLGMFIVHFSDWSSGEGYFADTYKTIVWRLFEERFWAMFGILFGVGFALQFRRAEERGEVFLWKYLRRMAGLAAFGVIAHAVFGFNVLLGYAAWGVPLVLVRNWSIRALIAALVLSAMSWNIYSIARLSYGVATKGEPAVRADGEAAAASNQAFLADNRHAQTSTRYADVFAARWRHMRWFYAQPFSFLPVNTLTLFLLGVLGWRLGVFERPHEHRPLIGALMVFGAASWIVATWIIPDPPATLATPMVRNLIVLRLASGLGLIREMWLAFTYAGLVLLLVARDPLWVRRLAVFGWTGRMALTNYMIQIAILDVLFSNYALGLKIAPLVGLALAIALFLADAALSRWWLMRFSYGPFEWLWRSITYARWQRWQTEAAPSAAQ